MTFSFLVTCTFVRGAYNNMYACMHHLEFIILPVSYVLIHIIVTKTRTYLHKIQELGILNI